MMNKPTTTSNSNDIYNPYSNLYTNSTNKVITYTTDANYTPVYKPVEYAYTPTTTTINTNYPNVNTGNIINNPTTTYYTPIVQSDNNLNTKTNTSNNYIMKDPKKVVTYENVKSTNPHILAYSPTPTYTISGYDNYTAPKYEPIVHNTSNISSAPKEIPKSASITHPQESKVNYYVPSVEPTYHGSSYLSYNQPSQIGTSEVNYGYTVPLMNYGIPSTNYTAPTTTNYSYVVNNPTTSTQPLYSTNISQNNHPHQVEKSAPSTSTSHSNTTKDNTSQYNASSYTNYLDYKPTLTTYSTSSYVPMQTQDHLTYTTSTGDYLRDVDKKLQEDKKSSSSQPYHGKVSSNSGSNPKDEQLQVTSGSSYTNFTGIEKPSNYSNSINMASNDYIPSIPTNIPTITAYNGYTGTVNKSANSYEIIKSNATPSKNTNSSYQISDSIQINTVQNSEKLPKLESKSAIAVSDPYKQIKDSSNDQLSKYNQLLKQHRTTGQKFIDPEFPPNLTSLTGGLSEAELVDQHGDCGFEWNTLIWCRPDDFYGKGMAKMYENFISSQDIEQGALGDCYFLSVLASLAETPHRIEKLLVSKEANDFGLYAVKICDLGEWKEIILDDAVPCFPDDNQPVFSRGSRNQLWVLLLEKAWAKLFGSYAKIEAGLTRDALHDLTGAPTKFYLTEGITEVEKQKLWDDIYQGEKMNFVMTCGAADFYGGLEELTEMGIDASQAYSLISAIEVNIPKDKVKLIKLKNPWGKAEWRGDWNINSSLWTLDLKKQLNVQNNDDGIFYMSFKDFLNYYSDVQICKIHDDFIYTSIKANTNHKNGNFFKMTIRKSGKYYISVNQQSRRQHDYKGDDFRYSAVWLVLAKVDGKGGYTHIEGCFRDDREVWTDNHLEVGEYVIYVKIAWFDKTTRDFVLSSYGVDDVVFTKVQKNEVARFMELVYHDKGRKSTKLENYDDLSQPNCYRAVELTDEGYGFIYYQNKSNKVLTEQINFNVLDGLKLCKPYRGNQYQIKVYPGEEKVILLKIDPNAETVRQSFSERARFE